ncbi:MAG: hypothetical protein GY913_30825 [Proteobacteria bacterium]|nr:hypothetical protein [Pseudomonadota bacterium]MCP4921311.1 hypothetical protein [Pseudomonadota bacterium]
MFWILGCGLGSPVPSGATEVELQVHALGYVRDGEQAVIETANEYSALLDGGGDTGDAGLDDAPDVDFDSDVVFTNWWVDGGCEDGPTYTAWVLDGTLFAHVEMGKDGGCDAYFPQLDILVAPRSGVDAFEWTPE